MNEINLKVLCVFLIHFALAKSQLDLPPYEGRDQNVPPPFRPTNNVPYSVDQYNRNNVPYENVDVVQNFQNAGVRRDGLDPAFNGDIRRLLQALDLQTSQMCTNNVAAQWSFETNVNQVTQLEAVST